MILKNFLEKNKKENVIMLINWIISYFKICFTKSFKNNGKRKMVQDTTNVDKIFIML